MIKILTDSASDFEIDEAEKSGLYLIPIQIRFGEKEYLDGVNLSHREFFEKLIASAQIPQTSQINEYRFSEIFKELTCDGSEVIAITLSSKLSGTFGCAAEAAKKYGGAVHTVDSLNASIGERILVQYALRLVKENLSAAEIVDRLNVKKKKIQVLAVLDTLKFLKKGGRISATAAAAGELLSVKPVISITDGEVKLAGKAIGSKKGNNLLNKLVDGCGGIDFDMPYCLGYSGLSDGYLNRYLKDSERLWKDKTDYFPSYMIGSTIGSHIGPNAIAVAFFSK